MLTQAQRGSQALITPLWLVLPLPLHPAVRVGSITAALCLCSEPVDYCRHPPSAYAHIRYIDTSKHIPGVIRFGNRIAAQF
jgi:hypothetical protein